MSRRVEGEKSNNVKGGVGHEAASCDLGRRRRPQFIGASTSSGLRTSSSRSENTSFIPDWMATWDVVATVVHTTPTEFLLQVVLSLNTIIDLAQSYLLNTLQAQSHGPVLCKAVYLLASLKTKSSLKFI